MLDRIGLFMIVVLGTTCISALSAKPPEVTVWAVQSVHKVRPQDPVQSSNLVWSQEAKTVSLAGAKNEHVPFQVVITTPPPPTRYEEAASGFWVEVSDLISSQDRISREQVRLYFEHVILCYAKSSPIGSTGFWPDALAPLTDLFRMRAAFRRAVRNRAIWVDILVPAQVAAGTYRGTLRVSQHNTLIDELTIFLKVYDFVLPEETHLLAHIGVFDRWFTPLYDVALPSPELRQLTAKYYDFLFANRMEPWFNQILQPQFQEGEDGQIAVTFDDELYEYYLNTLSTKRVVLQVAPHRLRNDDRFPQFSKEFDDRIKSYVVQVFSYFKLHGWLEKLVFNSPIDEPNTAEQYADTRKWAHLVHEAAPEVPFLVTESPVSDHPEWGTLRGHTNNFSIHGNALNDPAVKRAIHEEQQKGGEITWYISCDQKYPQPNYFIDASPMDPVMVPWITWRYGMDGILYWAINYWPQTPNPWQDPVTFLSGFLCSRGWVLNGEGSLVYPGNHTRRFTGQKNTNGPVSSIRFELLREGIEDYEYLWLLKSLGDEEFANRAVAEMVVDVSTFSRNVKELFRLREKLARRIEALTKK